MKSLLQQWLKQAGITVGGDKSYDIQIHDDSVYAQVIRNGSVGAGETYMDGLWDCPKLDEFFCHIMEHFTDDEIPSAGKQLFNKLKNTFLNLQTRQRSKLVAEQHYNVGNDLYQAMLGPSMAYTCAYYRNANTLDDAQTAKYDLICRKLAVQPGERILDLGCGFGGLTHYIAEKYGCEVVAVNIAEKQVEFAKKWCEGLPAKIFLSDYRDHHIYNPSQQKFDKVVSVGLCEHIGPKNYQIFLKVARTQLKPDGLCLIHTIGKNQPSESTDPWINKYIFPNGVIPTMSELVPAMEEFFVIEDFHNFGVDYDTTLMAWHHNFVESWPALAAQYDERFRRMWEYYLLCCAGAFRSRRLQLWQWVLSPQGVTNGYQSIR